MLAKNSIESKETSDFEQLKNHLDIAEDELAKAYTLALKMRESGNIEDERLFINLADSWHYAIETLRILGG